MTRNTCFLYKLRCTSYGNTALVRLYLMQLAHTLTSNDSSLSLQMEGHVFHITVTVLYTTTCCLMPKCKVPFAYNDQYIHYSFQCRDTALFFFTSFTSVYAGNIGQIWRSWYRASLMYSFKYNQQDATLYNILYCSQCSTCFRRVFCPSSGAQTVYTASGMCQACLLLPLAWVSWQCKLDTYQMLYIQFELLMMGGKTAWNM
jgi:hypothetical protein